MRSDRLNLRDLIAIMRHGLEQGAFSHCNMETLGAVRACVSSQNLTAYKAELIPSFLCGLASPLFDLFTWNIFCNVHRLGVLS